MNPAVRAAALAEWRRSPELKFRPDKWQAAADVLPKLMQQLGLSERIHEEEIAGAWTSIVGDFIATHSTPVSLKQGVLFVRVLQPSLHYELECVQKSGILRKLKQRFTGRVIKDIRFRLG
jgi:predicted nucleic acid-binding Zn ribbon protein